MFNQVFGEGGNSGLVSISGYSNGQMPGVQTGQLIGVGPMTSNPLKNGITLSATYNPMSGGRAFETQKINQTFGGGLLGSPTYLMMNLGRPDFNTPTADCG